MSATRIRLPDEDYKGPMLGAPHDGHPGDAQYIGIAIILSVLTGIEVAVSYITGIGAGAVPVLLGLAAIKFAIVGAYFMHLKFDTRYFRRLFITGIVLALFCYIVVLSQFKFFPWLK